MFRSEIVRKSQQLEGGVQLRDTQRMHLMIGESLQKTYKVNEVVAEVSQALSMMDLALLKGPYLPQSFQLQRNLAFSKLKKALEESSQEVREKCVAQFTREVDDCLLPVFLDRLKEPYWEAIMSEKVSGMPVKVDRPNMEGYVIEQEGRLAQAMGQWCIQVEVTYDLVQRTVLYGILDDPRLQLHHLHSRLTPHQKFSIGGWSLSFFKRVLIMFTKTFSKQVLGGGPLAQFQSLVEQFGVLCTVVLQLVGRKAFPWGIVHSLGMPLLPYVLGGYIGTKVTAKIVSMVQSSDTNKKLQQFITLFHEVTQNIQAENDCLSQKMRDYFRARGEERESLRQELAVLVERLTEDEQLLKLASDTESASQPYQQYQHELAMLKVENDDDWTLVQKMDMTEKTVDDGFVQLQLS